MHQTRAFRFLVLVAALLALPVLGTGCVQQDKYDQLITANRALEEQIVAVQDERDSCEANLQSMRELMSRTSGDLSAIQSENARLRGRLDDFGAENDTLIARISTLEIGPLPPDVESALEQLSRAYADLLTFDAGQGMLRFASDLTFDLGSAELRSEAAETIAALARILNSDTARGFEVRVIGHTDTVPIGKPSTRERHPTNLHLSVHRAIAVQRALTAASVAPPRIQVAGYGEHRPIVANGPRGAPQNRRVEVYIHPAGLDDAPAATAAAPTPNRPAAPSPSPTHVSNVDEIEPEK